MWHEVTIKRAAGGFGEYEAQPINGDGWEDASDLLAEMRANADEELVEVGSGRAEELGIGRPTIRNEPDRVFAAFDADANRISHYIGISEVLK